MNPPPAYVSISKHLKTFFVKTLFIICFFGSLSQNQNVVLAQTTCSFKLVGLLNPNLDSLKKVASLKKNNTVERLSALLTLEQSVFRYDQKNFGKNFQEIKYISDLLKNNFGLAAYYNFLGYDYQYKSFKFRQAITSYYKALELFTANRDTVGLVSVHNDLAAINVTNYGGVNGNAKQAFYHANQALMLGSISRKPELHIWGIKSMTGFLYTNIDNKENAKKLDSLQYILIRLAKTDPRLESSLVAGIINISASLINSKDYRKAIKLLNSISIAMVYRNKDIIIRTYHLNLSEAYTEVKEYNKAMDQLTIANNLSPTTRTLAEKNDIYERYIRLYKEKRQYEKATAYFDSVLTIRDSIYSKESSQNINDLQVKYETNAQIKENKILQKDSEMTKTKIRNYLIGLIILFSSSVIILLLTFRIRKSNLNLKNLNNKLKLLSDAQKQFISIIAHDLRSPINSYTDLLKTANFLLKKNQVDKLASISNQIDAASNKLDFLLLNLLNYALNELNNIDIMSNDISSVKPIILDVCDIYSDIIANRGLIIRVECPEAIVTTVNPNDFMIIIRNLIDNAIKYCSLNSDILITVTSNINEKMEIIIHNTGEGIGSQQLDYLNGIYSGKIEGFVGRSGLGLGTILIKNIVQKYMGTIYVESELNSHFFVHLILPAYLSKASDSHFGFK